MKRFLSILLVFVMLFSVMPISIFATSSEDTCVFGDADGNKNITIRDAAVILQYIAGWDVNIDKYLADVDDNGTVTIRDAAVILQYIAGWDVTGVGESYVVNFDLNYVGAPEIKPQRVAVGKNAVITMPNEREGYAFVGWYTDDAYENAFSFAEEVTSSCDIVARWVDVADTTDTDSDGLTDPWEEYYNTSKTNADTDNDGISDSVEILSLCTNPLALDSDDNGIKDGEEDFDEDDLTNAEELAVSSDCFVADTDADGIPDYNEVKEYGTSPSNADTDGDGLLDGDEIVLGLNPLAQKTNGVTLDTELTFEQTLESQNISESLLSDDNAAKPSLDITTNGNINSSTNIFVSTNESLTSNEAVVGLPIMLSSSADFSGIATLSFDVSGGVDMLAVGDDEEMPYLICSYNETEDGTDIEPLDTTYENGIVSAEISEAGTYFVLDVETLFENLGIDVLSVIENEDTFALQSVDEAEDTFAPQSIINVGTKTDADIVFVVDTVSMQKDFTNAKNQITTFVDKLVNSHGMNINFSLVEYNTAEYVTDEGEITYQSYTKQHKNGSSNWWNSSELSSFKNEINSLAIDNVDFIGGSAPIDALYIARNILKTSKTNKYIFLITDSFWAASENQHHFEGLMNMTNLLKQDKINTSVLSYHDNHDGVYIGDFSDVDAYLGDRTDDFRATDDCWFVYYSAWYHEKSDTYYLFMFNDTEEIDVPVYKHNVLMGENVGSYNNAILESKYQSMRSLIEACYNYNTGEYFYVVYEDDMDIGRNVAREWGTITDTHNIFWYGDSQYNYFDLCKRTGGYWGEIGSSFATDLEKHVTGTVVNTPSVPAPTPVPTGKYKIVLDNFEVVELDQEPTASSKADSDGDGVKDIDELLEVKTINFEKQIEVYLKKFGSTLDKYLAAGGKTGGDVWSFKSHPKMKDTDSDGIDDKDDYRPREYTVTDKTLALVAALSYTNLSAYEGKTIQDAIDDGVNIKKISDKNLKSLKNATVILSNESGAEILPDIFDAGLGSVAIMIPKNAYENIIIYGLRGTEPSNDLYADTTADVMLGIGLYTPQTAFAFSEYLSISNRANCDYYVTGHSLGGRLVQDLLYNIHLSDGVTGVFGQNISLPIHSATFNGLGYNGLGYSTLLPHVTEKYKDKVTNFYYYNDIVGETLGTGLFRRVGIDVARHPYDPMGDVYRNEFPIPPDVKYHDITYLIKDYYMQPTSFHNFDYWIR